MMIDFFKFSDYEEANIVELKRVIAFTADENKIQFRQYEVKSVNETDVKLKSLKTEEIGPHFDMVFRRDNIASSDLYKTAMRQPKIENME